MIDPREDIPGKLLTHPGLRGRLRVTPVLARQSTRTKALRVQAFTDAGLVVLDFQAKEVELTQIQTVDVKTARPTFHPGAIWFYGIDGVTEVGFLPDTAAAILDRPGATERPREGRQGAREARERNR